jgi:large subunit ribosomal protein L4
MKLDIYNQKGNKLSSKVELNKEVFGINPNEHCVYLSIKSELASKRQGTSKSKSKSEVRGTGSKPYKQKGTGRARVGIIRNPSRVSGGTAFGPEPRNYTLKINKKVRALAKKSILSDKVLSKSLMIIDKIELDNHKTKGFCEILKNLGLESSKVTFLISENNDNAYKGSRNIYNIKVLNGLNVSSYDLINNDTLVLDKETLNNFNKI